MLFHRKQAAKLKLTWLKTIAKKGGDVARKRQRVEEPERQTQISQQEDAELELPYNSPEYEMEEPCPDALELSPGSDAMSVDPIVQNPVVEAVEKPEKELPKRKKQKILSKILTVADANAMSIDFFSY